MKKLIALVLFVGTTLSFTACSSDDNSAKRVDAKVEGTWVSYKVSYKAYNEDGTLLHESPDGVGYDLEQIPFGKDPIKEEVFEIKGNNVILTETSKAGVITISKATLTNNVIHFEDSNKSSREILATTPRLTLKYNMKLGKATGVLTTTYNKKQ